jgi:hypothetical protein
VTGPVDQVEMVPVDALLSDDVVQLCALRLLGASSMRGWVHPDDLDGLRARWADLTEPLQTGYLTNARRDLERIVAAATEVAA